MQKYRFSRRYLRTRKVWREAKLVASAFTQTLYEYFFVLLPVIIWVAVLLSVGEGPQEIDKLVAWPFAAVSLFSAMLRDGISAFKLHTVHDRVQRDLAVIVGLIGVILSGVLLTMGVLVSIGKINGLWKFYYESTYIMVVIGTLLFLVVKATLIRRSYGRHA